MADKLPPEELAAIRKRHHKTNQYCEISGCSWDSHYQANDDRAALLRHVEALEQEVERKLARLVAELNGIGPPHKSWNPSTERASGWNDCRELVREIVATATGEGK